MKCLVMQDEKMKFWPENFGHFAPSQRTTWITRDHGGVVVHLLRYHGAKRGQQPHCV
jgi:hypothetical protein